ncbi:S66 family peptidase [Haliovirga abyssi]|uniref:Carboxypeptidase YocD n=1 Tax=Haliovirga abyssi TaxID=2996794 RepID=A0AAU9DED3_9FUSO|nr:S66 peptidase family protein [Haliovirga abyssi]BDU50702.1 putative carboxypeptidase YocD [Haliovirga abyssi]
MMIFPEKLKRGDEIRIIAPSKSLSLISEETRDIANKCFEEMGLKVSFSKNCEKSDEFDSSSIEERIEDLHEAFLNKKIKGIFTALGGYNANQMLKFIDYELIKNNPKIICGYSDITVLLNAIYKKTGMITYLGPYYSTFGMKKGIDYTKNYFKKIFFNNEDFIVEKSLEWSDDLWFLDQENRIFYKNEGYRIINKGIGKGKIIGGNLSTLNLLQGTEYMPNLENTILLIEDDKLTFPENFDRDLQSLIQQPNFEKVRGIIFGRFQITSKMKEEIFLKIIQSKKELRNIPIVSNVDFGHTTPQITFPIGGFSEINLVDKVEIKISVK